jgi:hypothetical protein
LRDAGILHALPEGRIELAWVGDLEEGAVQRLRFSLAQDAKDLLQGEFSSWRDGTDQGQLTLQRMTELACRRWPLSEGGFRLMAWTDQQFEGLRIQPRASQSVLRTLVLADLQRGAWPPAQPDVNLLRPLQRPEYSTPDDVPSEEPVEQDAP